MSLIFKPSLSALTLFFLLSVLAPQRADAGEDWWRWDYAADYSVIAVGAGLALGLRFIDPADDAAIGPSFDPEHPEAIFDPEHADLIGRRHREDTLTPADMAIHAGVAFSALMLIEGIPTLNGLDGFDGQLLHDSAIGFLEATTLTLAITQITKVSAGRLRPDFQDRARRYYCNLSPPVETVGCDDVRGAKVEEKAFKNGRMSFMSGHSSFSFSTSTYLSLALGGRFVWGDRADDLGAGGLVLGMLSQTALMTFAGFVAASRLEDGRHHPSDVVTGAIVGVAVAMIAYWRHFDTSGLPRGVRDHAAPAETTQPMGLSFQFNY